MVVAKKHHALYEELKAIIGPKYVSDELAVLLSYTRDISIFPAEKPQGIVVRPGSTEEVADILKLANHTRTPVIPIGGKATLCGVQKGAPGSGILVDMRRMDKIIAIEEEQMAVTAQAGITQGELASRLNEKGWEIHTANQPHYPNTIGGHISGVTAGGYGMYGESIGYNWHYILGVKVVLPDGRVVDTGTGEGSLVGYKGRTFARSHHGPDLTGMFIGAGGAFGIIVEATYRIFKLPKFKKSSVRVWAEKTALGQTCKDAYAAYTELTQIDPFIYMQPFASLILMPPETITFISMGTMEPVWAMLMQHVGRTQEEVDLKFKLTEEACAKHGGVVAEPKLLEFADTYADTFRNMGGGATLGPYTSYEWDCAPKDQVPMHKWMMTWFSEACKRYGIDEEKAIRKGIVFIPSGIGEAMYSFVPRFDTSDEVLNAKMVQMLEECLEEAAHMGMVLAGAQGREATTQARHWTPEYYDFALSIKKALDPNNIMSPGMYFLRSNT
jgi:glycolate oxidase